MQLPFGPAIALLGTYPRAMEAYVHQKKEGGGEKNIFMNIHQIYL